VTEEICLWSQGSVGAPQPWAMGLNPVGISVERKQSKTHNEPKCFVFGSSFFLGGDFTTKCFWACKKKHSGLVYRFFMSSHMFFSFYPIGFSTRPDHVVIFATIFSLYFVTDFSYSPTRFPRFDPIGFSTRSDYVVIFATIFLYIFATGFSRFCHKFFTFSPHVFLVSILSDFQLGLIMLSYLPRFFLYFVTGFSRFCHKFFTF
jgi:hypothetical protein